MVTHASLPSWPMVLRIAIAQIRLAAGDVAGAERIARSDTEPLEWNHFAEKNPDLLVWKDGVLSRYYREATLKSDFARKVFVLPDKSIELHASPVELAGRQR